MFKKLIQAAIHTAIIPVDIIKDVITMGGALTDKDEPYTVKRVEKVVEKIEEAADEV